MAIQRIMIAGGGTAAVISALNAREKNQTAEITILSNDTYPPYRRSILPKMIRKTTGSIEEIMMYSPSFLESNRIRLQKNIEVCKINVKEKFVEANNHITKDKEHYGYDRLIITTGSRTKIPQEGGSLKNIFVLRTFDDAKKIALSIKTGMRAIVVGAGLAALSISEALRKNKVKVTMIVRSRLLRSLLEPDLSYYLEKRLRMAGIDILKGVEMEKFVGKDKIQYAVASGKKIRASLAIIATGVVPNMELAQEAGIRTDKNGIIVDRRACTSDPDIYAAGDCAGTLDFISKQNIFAPVGSIAAQEAKIAGQNAAGNEVNSEGYLRAQYEKVFNMNILSMGHTLERAKRLGIEGDTVKLSPQLKKEDLGRVPTIIVKDQREHIIGIQELSPLQKLVNSFPLYQGLVGKISINELQAGWQDSILAMREIITRKFK